MVEIVFLKFLYTNTLVLSLDVFNLNLFIRSNETRQVCKLKHPFPVSSVLTVAPTVVEIVFLKLSYTNTLVLSLDVFNLNLFIKSNETRQACKLKHPFPVSSVRNFLIKSGLVHCYQSSSAKVI